MRTTVVPAQITSVEDKIAGNLSFTQLLLMIVPVFISAGLFVLLPPFTQFRVYKLAIASLIAIVCISLAIRIRGKLILEWLVVRGRYNLRPQFYVLNKNSGYGRKIVSVKEDKQKKVAPKDKREVSLPQLQFKPKEVLAFEAITKDVGADFQFVRSKKGGLHVRIKDVI